MRGISCTAFGGLQGGAGIIILPGFPCCFAGFQGDGGDVHQVYTSLAFASPSRLTNTTLVAYILKNRKHVIADRSRGNKTTQLIVGSYIRATTNGDVCA